MKKVEFKSPIKFKMLLQVHFEMETFNLLHVDNVYHTIGIKSLFGGVSDKECNNLLNSLKELLDNELTDYFFARCNRDLLIDDRLQMVADIKGNIYFSKVIHED